MRFQRYSLEEGLSQSTALSIVQDRLGFLWIGTVSGLNRFDGYEFKVYKHNPGDPHSLSDNYIPAVFVDSAGRLWVGTRSGGLCRYDPERDAFVNIPAGPGPRQLTHAWIRSIAEDRKGGLWIGTGAGLNRLDPDGVGLRRFEHAVEEPGQERLDLESTLAIGASGEIWVGSKHGLARFFQDTGRFERRLDADGRPLPTGQILEIQVDRHGSLWLATMDQGLFRLNPETGLWRQWLPIPGDPSSLSSARVFCVFEDPDGALWAGGERGGLHRFDSQSQSFIRHPLRRSGPAGNGDNSVRRIFQDRTGVLWVGSFSDGLLKLNPGRHWFDHVRHDPEDSESLSGNMVYSILQDSRDELWVGAFANGLNRRKREDGPFIHYRHDPNDPSSLPNDNAFLLLEDRWGDIWVGTDEGLARFDRESDGFERIRAEPNRPGGLQHPNLTALHQDRAGRLWVGTLGGVFVMENRRDRQFRAILHDPHDPNTISSNRILAIREDRSGAIWIGTDDRGLNRIDPDSGQAERFIASPGKADGLSHNRVSVIFEDRIGRLWIGAYGGGLNRFEAETRSFTHFGEREGLPDDVVYAILEDASGRLWLSSNRGLTRFDPNTGEIRVFDVQDGLQSNEFNRNAAFQRDDGAMFFGGVNGYSAFHPDDIREDAHPPSVALTDILFLNQSIPLRRVEPQSPLTTPITVADAIELTRQQYAFAIEFAALHFANPEKNRYAYKLEGLDPDWIYTDANRRFAAYANLSPGSYVFRVKAANLDGVWNETGAALRIKVPTPWWRTWWAYLLLAGAISALFWLYVRHQRRKLALKQAVVDRLRQLDNLKDDFLANTSHELRTPLNGIVGIAQSIRDGATGPLSPQTARQLDMVISSGRRLTNLVNDILDFSKLKNETLVLQITPVNLRELAQSALDLQRPLIGDKPLVLINDIPPDFPRVPADEDRVAQIFHNLIGNAVKFTKRGQVRVSAEVRDGFAAVHVVDTGPGLSEAQLAGIFDAFVQGESSTARTHGGTGLGLPIAKQLATRHGGALEAASTVGQGARFSFTLPLVAAETEAAQAPTETGWRGQAPAPTLGISPATALDASGEDAPHILVVDDELINRQVLVNHLSLRGYRLTEASGGDEALAILEQDASVDLVLLDVMMPRLSGYDVCRRLRERRSMQELPVLFLTAKNQTADLVQGFGLGANDYIAKPIERDELYARVHTQLQLLHLNRGLERLVADRTHELEENNRQLDAKIQELETLNHIVKTINREVDLKKVVESLLNQGLSLFPNARKGAFLLFDPAHSLFHVFAAVGHDGDRLDRLQFSLEDLMERYVGGLKEIERGVFIADRLDRALLTAKLDTVDPPQIDYRHDHHDQPTIGWDPDSAQRQRQRFSKGGRAENGAVSRPRHIRGWQGENPQRAGRSAKGTGQFGAFGRYGGNRHRRAAQCGQSTQQRQDFGPRHSGSGGRQALVELAGTRHRIASAGAGAI